MSIQARGREELMDDNKVLADEAFRLRAALGALVTLLEAGAVGGAALDAARENAARVLGRGR